MGNHTVNNKKGFIEGAAGKNDKTKTACVAWQNNRPQELEIEVTNSEEPQNLPFMIENGDLVTDSGKDVVISAKQSPDILKEFEKRRNREDKGEAR